MAAPTALAARSGWSVYRGIRWSIYRGIGGQFTAESGGQYQRILHYKVLLDKDTNQVLGAHLLGPHAEDVINIFTVAMNGNIKGDQLRKMIFSYPTNASDIVYML